MDWQELEFDEITGWPRTAQALVVLITGTIIAVAVWWFWLVPQEEQMAQLEQQELQLKAQFTSKAQMVAALPEYEDQTSKLRERYALLQKQLPEQTELASLLSSIHQLGIKHDLVFTRIDWGERQSVGQLYRYPLNIELTGSYRDIGRFNQAIGEIPRIVHFVDVDWQRVSQESQTLHFRVKAFTYQFKPEAGNEKA